MGKMKIQGNMANILTYLGSLYRNPGDAIKEYISNAIDEWQKARDRGDIEGPCEVSYCLEKRKIVIEYNSPGMNEGEFKEALRRVADSAKPGLTVPQIGELGIGIFAFNQVGNTCTFYSKKSKGAPTIKIVLRKQSDDCEIETATKREARQSPGMTIIISGLQHDPTRPRGPLAAERLQRLFAEKFDPYLREGNLRLTIARDGKIHGVKPLKIDLPIIGEAFREIHLPRAWEKQFNCQFWFDASGRSKVCIRHAGIPIVDDLKALSAYGLEESIFASGFVKGYIDADFLKPLPARSGFEENEDWIQLLVELDKIRPSLEDEVEDLRLQEEEKKLTNIQKKAIELAREILDEEEFKSLEVLGGLRRRRRATPLHKGKGTCIGVSTGTKSTGAGDRKGGLRIAFEEVPFEDGPSRHSEFLAGKVRVNRLNRDYVREMSGSQDSKLAYATLMVGKETISYNDKSKAVDDFLEKLLSYLFQVKTRMGSPSIVGRRPPGRPRESADS